MESNSNQTTPAKPWVKLHLAKQSDACAMPPWIIGVLQQELPGSYVLSNVMELHESGVKERTMTDYISRTYVYRLEILGIKPEFEDMVEQDEPYGGL